MINCHQLWLFPRGCLEIDQFHQWVGISTGWWIRCLRVQPEGPCSLREDVNPFLLPVSHIPILSSSHGAKVAFSPSSPCLNLCSIWGGQAGNFGRSRERCSKGSLQVRNTSATQRALGWQRRKESAPVPAEISHISEMAEFATESAPLSHGCWHSLLICPARRWSCSPGSGFWVRVRNGVPSQGGGRIPLPTALRPHGAPHPEKHAAGYQVSTDGYEPPLR